MCFPVVMKQALMAVVIPIPVFFSIIQDMTSQLS